ncbi:3-hydroxyacyl-thioester dehydratase HtdZ [Leifsonia bigeumensis]|uniref:3-hydroxyacyl-thioester dehydratase HtdZ n=1 Tax=Leifsonella bigeumensis TaxID=433643 RepID=A0ABP7FC02_9MICO
MTIPQVSVNELADHLGTEWGPTEVFRIDQDEVDQFARLVHDQQWIHVDPERSASGPFGATIVHGFFALAMCTRILDESVEITGYAQAINYGLDRVRFPRALPVGAPAAGTVHLDSVAEVAGGVQAAFDITLTVEGDDRPCMAARFLVRYLTA